MFNTYSIGFDRFGSMKKACSCHIVDMCNSLLIRARFHLAQFLDWGLHSGSLAKAGCYSAYRAVLKDRVRRPRIFAYSNWALCFLSLIYFVCSWGSMNLGIRRPTTKAFQRAFLITVFLEWMLAFGLIYAYKKGDNCQCQLWCIFETLFILIYLLFTLNVWVEIAWPGLALLATLCTIKLFGLWVIYYHSLELKSAFLSGSSRRIHNHRSEQDGMKISYFASSAPTTTSSKIPIPGKKAVTRRGTDQTSIATSGPPSPTSDHAFEHHQQNGLERRSSSMSLPPPHFQCFMDNNSNAKLEEPQYSEIMVDHLGQTKENIFTLEFGATPSPEQAHEGLQQSNQDLITVSPFSNGNIINSGLMCGGSSSINMEFVS